jgi:aryl-alcohol dehydrogenase-like predicted oxidoreductase
VTEARDVPAALAAVVLGPGEEARGALAPAILGGAASPEATSALARRSPFAATGYTTLGGTGLTVSRLGFGGYRVDDETPAHHQALSDALRGGLDVVDTSTNYTEGASERLFGQVLGEVVRAGERRREEIVVVSKIGYVQGENLERAQESEAAGRPLPEIVKYGEGVWHCIHPEFLDDQLTRSLARLRLQTLDVCLLHNPEYFLMDAHERSYGTLDRRRRDFYTRLAASFAFLEEQVRAGASAPTVSPRTPPRARPAIRRRRPSAACSRPRARRGADHHFRVLQLPLNLFESGAVLEPSDGRTAKQTVLDVARAGGVGVLANRPLNAMVDDGLVRLASVSVPEPALDLGAQLEALAALEDEYRTGVASHLQAGEGGIPLPISSAGAQELGRSLPRSRASSTGARSNRSASCRCWARPCRPWTVTSPAIWASSGTPGAPLRAGGAEGARRAAPPGRGEEPCAPLRLEAVIDPLLPPERRKESLSRKALWVVASTPA